MKILCDSSAWVEYLSGTKKGEKVRPLLSNQVFVTPMIVAEVCAKFLKDLGSTDIPLHVFSQIATIESTLKTAEQTAHLYLKHRKTHPKFGIVDANSYTQAQAIGATLITFDNDFRGLPGVKIL